MFTIFVSVLPFISFAYRSVEAHMAIETTAALTTAIAALLLHGRFRDSGRRSDLVLLSALALFAGTNLLFSVVPPIAGVDRAGGFSTWAPAIGRILAAVVFAWAAFASDEPVRHTRTTARRSLLAVAAVLAAVALLVAGLEPMLPSAIDPELSPDSAARPRLVGAPAVLILQLVAALVYTAAAVGFLRRAERLREELSAWLAVAATIAAFARLNFFLFPSIYSEWVYTGDLLRLGFFAALCVGAAREIIALQRSRAQVAVLDDRRRMAREIHDGLAQELAFIATHARRLGPRTVGRHDEQLQLVEQMRAAAERALDEARAAIDVLTLPRDEPLGDALCRAAENVVERHGARVETRCDTKLVVPRSVRDAMVRIVREAANNAVRHGEARSLMVEAEGPSPTLLRIADDGVGFDPGDVGRGFGLTSMRERAEALGGRLEITSAPGEGTTIAVWLP
jgi:signal transduction histidine kinase